MLCSAAALGTPCGCCALFIGQLPQWAPPPSKWLSNSNSLVVLLSHWSVLHWAPPTVNNCQIATVSEPTVSGAVVLRWSVRLRSGSRLSPGALLTRLALGQRMSWAVQETGWGLCPVGLQSPRQGSPLAGSALRWGESLLYPCPCDLMATAVCLASALLALSPPFQPPEELEGQLGLRCLAPSSMMTAGQNLGTWPWGSCQLRSAFSARTWALAGGPRPSGMWRFWSRVTGPVGTSQVGTWTSEGESCALGPCSLLSEQRVTFVYCRFIGTSLTWPQEQRIWYQKFCSN